MSISVEIPAPAVDVIESEEIVQYVHPALLRLDYRDWKIKWFIAGGSFTFFTIIFGALISICCLLPTFGKLDMKFKVFLSLSVARALYGVFTTIVGTYAIFSTTNLDRDIVFGTNSTSSFAMIVTVGFFMFELAAVVLSDIAFKSFSKMLIVHHGLGVISYFTAISLNANFSIGCKILILEMSTPFSCLSYVLLKSGLERTLIWKVNQMILVHTFHLRSMVECYLWYLTHRHWQYIYHFQPTSLLILTYVSLFLITFLMTPYWCYKKTQQLFNPVDWNFRESTSKNISQTENVDHADSIRKKKI